MSVFFQCPLQKRSGNKPMAHSSLAKRKRCWKPIWSLYVPPEIRPETSFRELRSLQFCDLEMYWMWGHANSFLSYVGLPASPRSELGESTDFGKCWVPTTSKGKEFNWEHTFRKWWKLVCYVIFLSQKVNTSNYTLTIDLVGIGFYSRRRSAPILSLLTRHWKRCFDH